MAAKLLKLRRGTTTQHSTFTGAEGEVTVDTDKDVLVVNDGLTAGGHPLAAEDMSNVSSASIAGRLTNDSIATSKIAAGALPTDVTIADANISGNLTIGTSDINNNSVDFTKLQNIDQDRIIGRTASGSGDATDLTAAQVRSMINVEDGATGDQTAAEIRTLVEAANDSNVFTDADHSKLDGIESGATGDQTSAEIKSLLASNNLTSAHLGVDSVTSSELANNAVDTNAIQDNAVTYAKMGDIAQNRLMGRYSSGSGNPETLTPTEVRAILNIENGATGDQTNAEIRAAIEAASDSNVFTDADHTKLNGIATSANLYVHPNHSGEVTSSGDGALTIANNVVDEANLKVSNSPTNGYFLQAQSGNTGGLTWAQVAEPDLTNLSASNLTSGTIPNARFPSTLPALNGSNLTNLAASALSGALPALDGSNLTNLASACTRVKAGIRTSEYDLPHYNQGYLDVPGTNVTFDNVSSDNVYLIYHGYQLRTTNAPNHTRTSYTVNAYISGPSHGGVGHYNIYSAHNWTTYGPFMSINAEQNTNNKTFSIKGRCSYYTHTYNSIQNVYMIVMEFKLS